MCIRDSIQAELKVVVHFVREAGLQYLASKQYLAFKQNKGEGSLASVFQGDARLSFFYLNYWRCQNLIVPCSAVCVLNPQIGLLAKTLLFKISTVVATRDCNPRLQRATRGAKSEKSCRLK